MKHMISRDEAARKYALMQPGDPQDLCHFVDFKAGWNAAVENLLNVFISISRPTEGQPFTVSHAYAKAAAQIIQDRKK